MSSPNLPGHPTSGGPPAGCPAQYGVTRAAGEAPTGQWPDTADATPGGEPPTAHPTVARHLTAWPGTTAAPVLPALYGAAFADDPDAVYRQLRQQGPVSWVELAPGVNAMLVTSYDAALEVLRSPYFSKDARRWRDLAEGRVAPDNEVLPMMAWRPSLLFADGERHLWLRRSVDDALSRVDRYQLRDYVQRTARQLIREFGGRGSADLVVEYADRLPVLLFGWMFGAPEDLVRRMAVACDVMMDAEPSIAQRGGAELAACLAQLVAMKRAAPGRDMTTQLLEHETGLSDEELVHQHVVLIGAGTVPLSAWIATSTLLLLTDDRFSASLAGGSLATQDALNEVLWDRSPLANFCFHYTTVEGGYRLRSAPGAGVVIPPGVPVLISHESANTDPVLGPARNPRRMPQTNHAHLAFGAGPHVCPAQDMSGIIAEVAIETLMDELPEIELSVGPKELSWRPGPFHRSLTQLPVRFPPKPLAGEPGRPGSASGAGDRSRPDAPDPSDTTPGETSWTSTTYHSSTPPAATRTPRRTGSGPRAPRPKWYSRLAWWRGR